MSNIKAFIDYSMEDNGSSAREALYADIHDRVMSAIEAKKMELAGGMLTRESTVSENVNEKLLKAESKVARLKEELALMEAAMCDSDDDDDADDSEYKEKKKKLKKAKKKVKKLKEALALQESDEESEASEEESEEETSEE